MRASGSPTAAGLVLGAGIGGFIDGIVIHQLIEWHHMLSGWYPPDNEHHLRVNMLGDGFFHLGCLLIVLAGVALLVRAAAGGPVPGFGRQVTGWMVAGWGWFNLVEGVIDHLVLGVHHVRHGPGQLYFDLGFLAFGLLLIALGTLVARSSRLPSRAEG